MLYRPSTQTSIPIPIPSPVAKRRIAIAPRCNLRSSRPICIVIAVSWCLRRSGRAPRASHPIPPAVHHQDRWALQKWRWRARGGRDRSPVADLDRRHRPQMVRRTAATVTRPRTCPRTARARPPAPAYQTVHQVVVMKRQQHHHHRAERPMSTRAHKNWGIFEATPASERQVSCDVQVRPLTQKGAGTSIRRRVIGECQEPFASYGQRRTTALA